MNEIKQSLRSIYYHYQKEKVQDMLKDELPQTGSKIKKIVVAGAGLMGASIAQSFPEYGVKTTIYTNQESDYGRARQIIANSQRTLVENQMLTPEQSQKIQEEIGYTTDPQCFADADWIIEAVPEDFQIKKNLLELISDITPEDTLITTNTSAISINALSRCVSSPARFCGTHWLNPPHIIPLVELIRGEETGNFTIELLSELLTGMGKQPVVLKKDIKGFLSNRLQFALLREATYLVENGIADPEDIDRTLKYGNGLRYTCSGPFKIVDFGGI
ncbi:MAG TPA: 3-hydroxyacyl-CoA dehydrogenase family protein, partial [Lachnospiraceae bacterium]|nr:3-hydroxyacyl-CoA dehydrogenase family protein [Lachnospiraceae bacterium]